MKKKRDTRNAIMRTEMETRFPSLSRAPFTNKDPIPGRAKIFSTTAVSVTGGVLHNVGQILVACLVLETDVLLYYLPVLILSGTITGAVIGIIASLVIKRLENNIRS